MRSPDCAYLSGKFPAAPVQGVLNPRQPTSELSMCYSDSKRENRGWLLRGEKAAGNLGAGGGASCRRRLIGAPTGAAEGRQLMVALLPPYAWLSPNHSFRYARADCSTTMRSAFSTS